MDMNFKKSLIIMLSVLFVLMVISSVNATDSLTDTVNATNENVDAVNLANDENDGEILGDGDVGTFDELYSEINGNTSKNYIELGKDYHGSYDNGNGIQINRANVVIDGKGHTIDCSGESSRMFNIRVDGITLKNITFIGGTYGYGGAIYTNKYITIINCTFKDNHATGTGSGYGGGAIYCSNIKISAYNCKFINNHANLNGGAILAAGSSSDDMEIFNCTFVDNVADDSGGAIYTKAYNRLGNVINSTFIHNNAKTGGVIYNYADAANIDRCIFINNTATNSIFFEYGISVNNSILINNIAEKMFDSGSPTIGNNWWGTTADNYQDGVMIDGKAITKYYVLDMYLDNNNGEATVSLNNFYENGILISSYQDYALPSIKFNIKAIGTTADGDSIVLGSSGVNTFTYNLADAYSISINNGLIELTREIKPTFILLNNKIATDGVNEINLEQDYEWDSSKDASLTKGITFAKDMTIDGQSHVIDAKGSINIFYFDDISGSYSLTLKNIIFKNAITTTNGAAVYFKGNKIEIVNCTFINNTADLNGDVIYIADSKSNSNKITESLFINNSGVNSVVYSNLDATDAKLELTNSIFLKNSATVNIKGTSNVIVEHNWCGNTIENYDDSDVSKVDGVTLNNWLFLKIDADAVLSGNATLSLNNIYDGSEVSVYGGYSLPTLTLNLGGLNTSVQVSSISLDGDGQATYKFKMNKTNGTLTASYEDVTTTKELQYITNDDGSFKALNEIIWFSSENDVIELTHDFVYSDSDTLTPGIQITKTLTINGNNHMIDAKGKSGIFLINSPNVVFKNIIFKNGIFEKGGAIYASQNADHLTVDNCTFINNTATNTDGGAIWSGSYRFGRIVNSTFINNTAVEDGAAFFTYSFYEDAVIDRCLFINNSAQYTVIYADYLYDLHDSIFLDNVGNKLIDGTYAYYGTVGNNWYGNTFDDYNSQPVQMPVYNYNWLYLNIKFNETHAIVSLNNLYTKSSGSSSVYSNYNLPEITLNVNSTTLNLETDAITLDSNGRAIVSYTMIGENGALTVSYGAISLTRDRVLPEFNSLQTLIDNAQENSVIELTQNYTYNAEDEITKGIIINKNITIDGKGHTIDAKDKSRIFNIQALGVTFKNIIFANGNSDHGSAICYENDNTEKINFEIFNCTFVNNTANNPPSLFEGSGAIYIKTNCGDYKIIDSKFENNKAIPLGYAMSKGGAIYLNVKNSEVTIYNSSFISNSAYNGGALYVQTDNSETIIDKSLFRNNNYYSTDSNRATTIFWKTTNDNGNNMVKNSIFLDNRDSVWDNYATFVLNSGNVNIDDNWWGSTRNNYNQFGQSNYIYTIGITPNSWLFLNASVSSYIVPYNKTSTIYYILNSYDGENISNYDVSKLPHVEFNVECDIGQLSKNNVSLDEELIYKSTLGNSIISITINNRPYEFTLKGPGIIPIVDEPFIIYANQGVSKRSLIKTANGLYNPVTITCNDTTLINLNGNHDIDAYSGKEGTVKLTFTNTALTNYATDSYDFIVKVSQVPLNITVTNIESNEILLNVGDTLNLDIAFEIDSTHAGYAPAWQILGFECDSNIISFTYDDGARPDNGSYYPTGHINAKVGGTTNLTIYSTSKKFKWENYTIKITVNKIPTEITLDDDDSFKVDDTSKLNATFLINGTPSTASLIYESSDENVINFTSNTGDFKAVGNGTAVLTVRFAGNSTHENSSKTITVTVTKYETTTSITSDKELSLKVDDESQISADLTSEDPSFAGVISYASSDESVAIVDSNGKITAVGEGSVIITAKYDGNYKYANSSDSLMVTVSKIDSSITINTDNPLQINVFDESQIDAVLNHIGNLSYASSNPEVVTVNQTTGRITAKAGGRANITVSYSGDHKYTKAEDVNLTVIVKKLPSHITVDGAISVDVDANNNIVATIDNGRTLRYVSANPSIVTVDESTGVITGVIGGTANVTVIFDEDGQYLADEANVTVTVNKLQSTFTIESPMIEMDVYGNALIIASSNNDGEITYVSCDALIATVNGNNVTALKGGKVNVTLSVAETDRYLANATNITVTVNKLQSTIVVVDAITINVDESKLLGATVDENRQLRFESADSGIVTVNDDGEITGVIGGTANVTVIFDEDDQYLGSEVNVTVTVNKLEATINVEPISVDVYQNKSLNAQIISDGDILYTSTNPSIVTVNEIGYVTGVIGGKVNVTISVGETNRYLAKVINVTVTVNKLPSIFTNGPMSLSVDENATINSTLNHDGKVRYEFDSTKLNVTEDGLVIALSGGVHTIVVKFDGNEIYLENASTVTVTVSRLPADYVDEPINLTVFETSNIEFLIEGYDHTNSQYSSSNETVFTVDSNGLITANAGGSALLNIKFPETDRYLGNSINITVNVKKLPTILTADNQISVKVDETKNLAVSVNHNRQLIYESSNPDIVTVDDNGLIKGIIGGTAFITVRYDEDGQYLANSTKVSVTVNKLPSNINVETQPITIYIDDDATVIATTDNDGGLFFTTNSSFISLSGDGKVTGVSEGTADIVIAVFETDTHLSNRTTLKVTVKKIPTSISVEGLQLTVDVDESILINASLNHPEAGPLNFTSSNPEVVSVDGDGRICALIGGEANITISYAGDDKYIEAQDVIVNVVSNRLPTVIKVNGTFSLKVDDSVLIGAFPNHDGMQLKYMVGNSSVITIDGATGEITAIAEGVTDVTISCEGTDKYLKAENVTVSVEVTRIQTEINISSVNPIEINVFDESAITASLNYPQAGILTYTSSDENVVTVDEDGIIAAIGGGKANITISYAGNYKYAPAENVTVSVVVNKLASSIIVDDELSVDVDNSKSLNAYMEIDRPLRYVSNNESIAFVDDYGFVTGLIGGKTNITVIFDGDSQYEGCEANVTVTVNKLASKIDVESQHLVIEVGSNAEIIATTNSDAYLAYVSLNSTIASVNGIVVTGVIGGTVNVTVSVPESDRYLASEVNVTVVVNKLQSVIIIENDNLEVDVDGTVNIVATTNSDGNLTYVSLDSAVASVDGNVVTGVSEGVVKVSVSVAETDKYHANEANVTVVVNKLQSVINLESDSLVVDVDGTVNIVATTNSDGNLTYVSLDSAVASVEGNVVTGVSGGTVKVSVSVAETDKYLANEANVTVVVNKLQSVINLEGDSLVVDVDGNVLINASTNSDAGLTYVSLDPAVAAVEGNVVTGISSGIVNVTLSVSETARYLAKDMNVTVTVNKAKSVISANNITVYVDETKSIDATLNVDGNLRYINNNPELVLIDETGVVKGLIGGTAKITIIFDETDKYLGSEVNVTVTVNKLHSVIDLESDSLVVEVEGNVLINASTNSDAGLIYESLDESVATVNLNNVTALIGGKVIVSVSVPESDRYLKNSVNVTVVVKKHDSIISIENDEIAVEVDGKQQIVASTNSDRPIIFFTTSPIISIGGTGMVTGVSNGTAEVILNVAESDKYSANTSVVTVKVNKVPTAIIVNESISVTVDDEINLNATLDHEGQLSFTSLDESIASVDAQGNIKAVKVGKTQIIVSFEENEKYLGNSITVDVTVNKIDIPINDTISMDLQDASRTPTFSIDLPNATGNFSVIVDGKEIGPVSLKDGKANITVPELAYGSHNVTVVYSGDDKYGSIAQNTTVNITKPVLSENKDIAMLYTANAVYKVHVTVEGKAVVGQNVTFKFNGKTYDVKTDKNGYAAFKLPSAKPKKAKYVITATFHNVTVKNNVKVNSIIKAKNLKIKKSRKVVKIRVSLKKVNGKYLKGKQLKLKIKGKTLKAKTNKKGVATFKLKKNVLKKLKVGKKYKYRVSYGKDAVTKKLKVKR